MGYLVLAAEAVILLMFAASLRPGRTAGSSSRGYVAPVLGTLAAAAVFSAGGGLAPPWGAVAAALSRVALAAQPLFLIRLVGGVRPLPRPLWVAILAVAVAVCLGAAAVPLVPPAIRPGVSVAVIAFFLALEGYGGLALRQGATHLYGVGRQRANALALASAALVITLALALALPAHAALTRSTAVAVGVAVVALLYAAAVVPPAWLRHAWQLPPLIQFFEAVDALPATEEAAIARELVEAASRVTGGWGAAYLVRDAANPVYRRVVATGRARPLAGETFAVTEANVREQAWQTRLPAVSRPGGADPPGAEILRRVGARRVLAVPVAAEATPLGLLEAFALEDWLFVDDDLALLSAMGRYAAVRLHTARVLADQAQAARVLEEANAALQRANRAKSDFLSAMSHELRTPLNAILGFSDLLLHGQAGALNPRQHRYVSNIFASGQHLLQIVSDVLDIAKADAARLELHLAPVVVSEVVEASLRLVGPQAAAGGLTLRSEVPPTLTVQADPLRLRQVVVNLLSNAVRFTPEGGRVTVGAQSLGPQVEVWVEDTGVGIPAEALPTLFDEFTQVSQGTDRAHEGTGLGLALVRRLVGLMGGRVDVRSEVGRGSRFTVTLPAAAADPGASQRATGSGGPAAGADAQPGEGEGGRTTRPGTVLVLDDDPMVGELSRQVLEDAGYRVVVTRTLAEARRALRERTPQVVLLDVVLAEGEDGYALLPDLRALDPPPATAVISIVDAGRRAMEPPVRLWLVKPVRPEALRQAVASLLAEGEVRHG